MNHKNTFSSSKVALYCSGMRAHVKLHMARAQCTSLLSSCLSCRGYVTYDEWRFKERLKEQIHNDMPLYNVRLPLHNDSHKLNLWWLTEPKWICTVMPSIAWDICGVTGIVGGCTVNEFRFVTYVDAYADRPYDSRLNCYINWLNISDWVDVAAVQSTLTYSLLFLSVPLDPCL